MTHAAEISITYSIKHISGTEADGSDTPLTKAQPWSGYPTVQKDPRLPYTTCIINDVHGHVPRCSISVQLT